MTVPIQDRDAFGHWLSGFVDGEGCFGIYCYKQGKKGKFDPGFLSFEFSIQLREDDLAVLESIQKFFGVGSIVKGSREKLRKQGRKNARDQRKYTCRRIEDLWQVIVPHFERYPLRSKKANDFLLWKKALELQLESIRVRGNKNVPIHLSDEAIMLRSEIFLIAKELRASRNPALQRGENSLIEHN